jgi:glycerol kinase
MAIVIALDAGTTGVRALAFDHAGTNVGSSYREFTQHFPEAGWVEHDAGEIWQVVQTVLGELVDGLDQAEVAAIGITDQRETTVVWDRRTGEPLHRAIVWQDRRTASRCDELSEQGHLPLVRATTGLVLDPYFSASKLEWLFTRGGVEPGEHVAFWHDRQLAAGTSREGPTRARCTPRTCPTPAAPCCSTSATAWSPGAV